MVIVAGHLTVKPGQRRRFVDNSAKSVAVARRTKGCFDFAVSEDSVDPNRVNVFERWQNEEALTAFRGTGPDSDLSSLIASASVSHYVLTDESRRD